MKRVKRTNAVVIKNPLQGNGERIGEVRRDPIVMDMNREKNCYSCKGFGHLVWNCKK